MKLGFHPKSMPTTSAAGEHPDRGCPSNGFGGGKRLCLEGAQYFGRGLEISL